MLKAFLIIKTKRLIPADPKGIFSPIVSLKSMWMPWKEFFSRGLNCRLLNVWYFKYCPMLIWIHSDLCLSWLSACGQFRMQIWFMRSFSSQLYPKSLPTLFPKLCPKLSLKNARPDLSFARWISISCFFPDNITVIQQLLWLSRIWMSVFMAWTICVMKRYRPSSW